MARSKTSGRQTLNNFCLLLSGLGLGWLVGLSVSPVIQTILTSLIAVVVSVSTALAGLHRGDAHSERDEASAPAGNEPGSSRVRNALPELLDPLPVMCMVVGLACGASVGVYGRTNNWLGARSNIYVEEWRETGLSPKEITTRVFDLLYPPPVPSETTTQESAVANPTGDDEANTTQPPLPTGGATQPAQKSVKKPAASQPAAKQVAAAERQSSFRDGILFATTLEQCKRLANAEDEDELRREMASSNDERLVNLSRTCKNYECLRAGVNRACARYS